MKIKHLFLGLVSVSILGCATAQRSNTTRDPASNALEQDLALLTLETGKAIYPLSAWTDNFIFKLPEDVHNVDPRPHYKTYQDGESDSGAVAIPHGNSSQSAVTDVANPRTVVGITALRSNKYGRFDVWFGHARKAQPQVDAIVCSDGKEECSFYTVSNYAASPVPKRVDDSAACFSCHQSKQPVHVDAPSNSTKDVAKAMKDRGSALDPIAVWAMAYPRPFGSEPESYFDEWIKGTALGSAWTHIYRNICADDLGCRRSLLLASLFGSGDDHPNPELETYLKSQESKLSPIFLQNWDSVAYTMSMPESASTEPLEPLYTDASFPGKKGVLNPAQVKEKISLNVLYRARSQYMNENALRTAKALGFKKTQLLLESDSGTALIKDHWNPLDENALAQLLGDH